MSKEVPVDEEESEEAAGEDEEEAGEGTDDEVEDAGKASYLCMQGLAPGPHDGWYTKPSCIWLSKEAAAYLDARRLCHWCSPSAGFYHARSSQSCAGYILRDTCVNGLGQIHIERHENTRSTHAQMRRTRRKRRRSQRQKQ